MNLLKTFKPKKMTDSKYLEEINSLMWGTWGVKNHEFGRNDGEKIMAILDKWASRPELKFTQLSAVSPTYPLFKHMADEHGLTLTETELFDIISIVREMDKQIESEEITIGG